MTKVAVAFGADKVRASEEMKQVAELIITLTRVRKKFFCCFNICKDYSTGRGPS